MTDLATLKAENASLRRQLAATRAAAAAGAPVDYLEPAAALIAQRLADTPEHRLAEEAGQAAAVVAKAKPALFGGGGGEGGKPAGRSLAPWQLTQEQARDPATYRAAKAEAEKAGVAPEIV